METLKLTPFAAALATLSLVAMTPATAQASVRPQDTIYCGESLAMWVGSGDSNVNVSGDILPCGGTWTPAFLYIYRIGPGGSLTIVAWGDGEASYTCKGTTPNNYEMGGQDDGITYTTGVIPCS